MPEPMPRSERVRFGNFEAHLRAAELYKSGKRVKIQELPFQVLSILLENAGQVVTREDLRTRIWPADTFVDFDHGLAVAVNKLRQALGDSAETPRFVETIGKRGYRFLAPIETPGPTTVVDRPREPAVPTVQEERPRTAAAPVEKKKSRWLLSVLIAAALVLLALVGWRVRTWRHATAAAASPISSLAVLPLENLSGDRDQEYFVEGMTDELITDLAKLPNLRVISRTSTSQYKGTRKTAPEIGRELNVDGIVEGTVQRSGDRVRLRVQLIYAPRERHLWAEAYERDVKDVLSLQAELARDIAGEIRLTLTSQQQAHLAHFRPVDPAAHELYLKGRYYWNKRTKDGFDQAIQYFQQAIERDPNYAEAYVGLADCYVLLSGYTYVPQTEVLPKARTAAEKALQIDDTLAAAHTSLALIIESDWNWEKTRKHFQRALELDPNYATAHHWYAEGYLAPVGRLDEALAELHKAQELDPLSAIIATDIGKELYFARRYDEAITQLQKVLAFNPDFEAAMNWLWMCYVEKGMYAEAFRVLDKKSLYHPQSQLGDLLYLNARAGRTEEARKQLRELLERSRREYVNPGAIAVAYAALGDKDRAFAYLEQAYRQRSVDMTSLKVWAFYDPLRSDPRFQDLLRRVGLPN